jgi:site-specific recombinase XerD
MAQRNNQGARRPRKDKQLVQPAQPAKQMVDFDRALSIFLAGQVSAGHSEDTQKDYRCVVGLFVAYMKDTHSYVYVDQVVEENVLGWLVHLHGSNSAFGRSYSSLTIQTYWRDVSTFFRWLVRHGYLEDNPMARIDEPKADKPLIRVFTEDELKALDAACDRAPYGRSLTPDERKMLAARDRAIFWLMLSTGIRLSELCGLRFCDVDWKSGEIYVFGKGSKERRVPFGSVARQHLNTYVMYWRGTPENTDDSVFLNVFGQKLGVSGIKEIFSRIKKIAGITDKRVSAHTCRHWFAVNAIKNGMPTKVLKDILGHATWEMIETYVRLAQEDIKESYAKFSPVDSLSIHHSVKGRRERARDWRNSRKRSDKDG